MNYRATKPDYSDLLTFKQANKIRVLANEKRINVREECNRVCGCKEDELSRSGAQTFIDHLESLTRTGELRGKAIITAEKMSCRLMTPEHRNLDVYNAIMQLPKQHRQWNGDYKEWSIAIVHLGAVIALARRYEQAEMVKDGVTENLKNAAAVPAIPDVRQP